MHPNQFDLQTYLLPQTTLPCQEGVLVAEEQLDLEFRAQSALHPKPVSGPGWGEPKFTSHYDWTV